MKKIKSVLAISFLGLMALLPLSWAQFLGAHLGRYFFRKGDKNKWCRFTQSNIAHCFPELSEDERNVAVQESLIETGKSVSEMGMSWLWAPKRTLKKVVKIHHEELITNALSKKKGVILIAPHLGNWEVLNLYLSNKYSFTAMYKPPKQPAMDKLIKRMRARLGSRMAPANVQGVRMVMKALRRGEMVGILPDQEPDLESGIYVPFFNSPALTMKLLPQLAAQTGASVICGFAKRLPHAQGFEIYFYEGDPEINQKDLSVAASAMNRTVENCVRQAPWQYQWEYKRFSSRPEGEADIYQ
ncbi:lauroyl acyltransferase [Nitrincola tibetensis]|uniref:Lauroyl acyltransferase n=1 Tax=Nitrincola tibetensis TaxID=2219697 RepID=A0A364NLN5_9GAMM|nr:lysophospholipid acyltransferase family protein [Nitrincola tibetensis]RAU18016.1 lauroyl acyltransferase [Nitrincola tibetensis]